jgi:NAD(P)-dependent dehydrogenase (short-subunit alcohol dehydrogenase family)
LNTPGDDDNAIVLISGGASGIGRHVAEAFLDQGAQVHVCDASQEFIDEFLAANPSATATLADVSDVDQVLTVFADLDTHHGGLSTLILNAGIAGPTAAVEDVAIEEWDRCISVNQSGAFYVVREAVPRLKANGSGSIVNVASNAGLFGCPNRSPYAASKWAMIGLMKTWAMELGPFNIRVNAVCPTSVEGARIERVIARDASARGLSEEQIREVYQRQSSMRTFVSADDVTEMVMFLASDRAARISGQAIAVDGNTETLANWMDD